LKPHPNKAKQTINEAKGFLYRKYQIFMFLCFVEEQIFSLYRQYRYNEVLIFLTVIAF